MLGSPMEMVVSKLEACQKRLVHWSGNSFCHMRWEIIEKKKLLKVAESEAAQGRQMDRFLKLKSNIVDLFWLDEKMWQQCSKEHWIISEDRNSKYLHTRASQCFHRNTIMELRNPEGVLVSSDGDISVMVQDYYKNVFLSSRLTKVDDVVLSIKPAVIDDMNNHLINSFSQAKIECALSQMAPLKAPGPDGVPPIFFQKFWSVVGDDVVRAMLFCLNSGSLHPGLNHTFISLIPKFKNPQYVTKFRPIALYNILYKLVSKVLAKKLKNVLPHIISESQSTFQSNKEISNNILVAFETLHHMKRKKGGKSGHLALKLDISKAYDRLEWVFLKKVMERMGFHSQWVGWIMECVQSMTYLVLINGEPTETITPSRGIRQRDPLSPYLFLLCLDGFSGLLEQVVAKKSLEGFSLCKYGPKICHLLFANNSLLFCWAGVNDVSKILEILRKYERASGQKLKANKTTIFFGGNVMDSAKMQVQSLLGVSEIKEYENYLGLPVVVGRHKKASFNYIKNHFGVNFKGGRKKFYPKPERRFC